jgi:hypothetical protein
MIFDYLASFYFDPTIPSLRLNLISVSVENCSVPLQPASGARLTLPLADNRLAESPQCWHEGANNGHSPLTFALP